MTESEMALNHESHYLQPRSSMTNHEHVYDHFSAAFDWKCSNGATSRHGRQEQARRISRNCHLRVLPYKRNICICFGSLRSQAIPLVLPDDLAKRLRVSNHASSNAFMDYFQLRQEDDDNLSFPP